MNDTNNQVLMFGIFQTTAGMTLQTKIPAEELLPLLSQAVEDVRMQVLLNRIKAQQPKIAVVPANALTTRG